jgi:hypothetical protein
MDIREILEIVAMITGTAGLGVLFYFYYTNDKVKIWVDRILKNIPLSTVLNLAASKVEDKKGEFDTHDALKVSARLADFLRDTIADPSNTNFNDVDEEVFEFLNTELDRYRKAGVAGVPDIDDQVLRTNVKVVFEQIVRALGEDSTGNNS